jgi:predicted GNAT family acetyltransferase
MRRLLDSRDSLDKLYRDANSSLTTLERSHRFTMSELDRQRDELTVSHTEVSRLNKLLSSKESAIGELRASKKLVSQESKISHRNIRVLEDDRGIMKAMCDKAMDKAIRAGRILMKRPGVVVLEDIVADILAASAGVSKPSPSNDPSGKVSCENASAQ